MNGEQTLEQTLAKIAEEVEGVAQELANQAELIAELKGQVVNGVPVTQDQLDTLNATAVRIKTRLSGLLPQPAPTPAPESGAQNPPA